MTRITLAQADAIIAAALEEGRRLNLKPLTIVVLDAGGVPVALRREDGASNLRPQLATGKAAGALALGMSSRAIAEVAEARPSFVGSLGAIAPGGLIPAAGGVLVVDDEGRTIGAVGATGDTSDNDELCVLAGLKAAGLRAQG